MPEDREDLQNEEAEEELDELEDEKIKEAEAATAAAQVTADVIKEVEADEVLKDLATDTPIKDKGPVIQKGTFVDHAVHRAIRRRSRGGRGFA